MSVFDRAGNLLKGLLTKPLRALEKSEAERLLERELEEKAALERARARVSELEDRAGEPAAPRPASSARPPEPAPSADPGNGGKSKRRMGPDE